LPSVDRPDRVTLMANEVNAALDLAKTAETRINLSGN